MISAHFDFLDPDVSLVGLPVDELAELRRSEPLHWVDVPGGTGREQAAGCCGSGREEPSVSAAPPAQP